MVEAGMMWISLFSVAMAVAVGLSVVAMVIQRESVRG
jgi:hypothetical protein